MSRHDTELTLPLWSSNRQNGHLRNGNGGRGKVSIRKRDCVHRKETKQNLKLEIQARHLPKHS